MTFTVTIADYQHFTGKQVEDENIDFIMNLLQQITDLLRQYAQNYGYLLDLEIESGRVIESVAKQTVCQLTEEAFDDFNNNDLGDYDNVSSITRATGTYSETLNFGEAGTKSRTYIQPKVLKMLGLNVTKYGRIDI